MQKLTNRLSEALMSLYKLFWDEFSSWYLEMVKPAYQQPIDKKTYEATLGFFDSLLRLLHPYMPFITEELWQALTPRKEGESIMYAEWLKESSVDEELLKAFDKTKEIVAGVRTIRLQRNIANKDALSLEVIGNHDAALDSVIIKMCNLSSLASVTSKDATSAAFLVGTTEYAVQLGDTLDVEAEIEKMEAEIKYLEGFLISVDKKLSNERFVVNAKPEIVEVERNKKADAESKIKTLKENIAGLKK